MHIKQVGYFLYIIPQVNMRFIDGPVAVSFIPSPMPFKKLMQCGSIFCLTYEERLNHVEKQYLPPILPASIQLL